MNINDAIKDDLIALAAELAGTVRDFGPEDVRAVLHRIPGGRRDEFTLVLAAMVDPDASPSQLLAWQKAGPVQSRDKPKPRVKKIPERKPGRDRFPREHGSDRGYHQHRRHKDWPACDPCLDAHSERTYQLEKVKRDAAKNVRGKAS